MNFSLKKLLFEFCRLFVRSSNLNNWNKNDYDSGNVVIWLVKTVLGEQGLMVILLIKKDSNTCPLPGCLLWQWTLNSCTGKHLYNSLRSFYTCLDNTAHKNLTCVYRNNLTTSSVNQLCHLFSGFYHNNRLQIYLIEQKTSFLILNLFTSYS